MIERNSRLFARHAVTSFISLYQHIRVCLVQLELSGTIRFLKTTHWLVERTPETQVEFPTKSPFLCASHQ